MKKTIFDKIADLLLKQDRYVAEDGTLLKAKVHSDIMTMNKELITLLVNDDDIKKHFFTQVDDTLVFDKQQFAWLLDAKEFLPDSYTSYENKIGLTDGNNNLISKKRDVTLVWPYKDCILEGGQTKDDQKRDEIFYNETLALDEVTRLLDPKVLSNAKRYTKDGIEEDIEFKNDDNLIIKGNNLLALSSLLEKYRGKVKSVIIDPPYYFNATKSSDAFQYNSNFKLSTWLTFMKNRLEIAYNLLDSDGFMAVIIGKDGLAELKILMDEIFDVHSNYRRHIATIAWRKTDNQSNIGDFANVLDYILLYRKDENTPLNRLPLGEVALREYRYEDEVGRFRRGILLDKTRGRHYYDVITKSGNVLNGPWMKKEEELKRLDEENLIYWTEGGDEQPYTKIYLKDSKGMIPNDEWGIEFGTNQRGAAEIEALFGERVFDFPKPEKLLENLIKITSNEGDLVLDFFMGSATTPATAHKMNRKYIGIEQMDYIEDIAVERLRKVIEGEQGGISKSVNWQGGGSFVYCELLEDTNTLIDMIEEADEANINEIKEKIYKDERIVPYISTAELEEADADFMSLSLEDKKKALLKLIDKNKLYVNLSDLDDEEFSISEEDKKFTRSFYGGIDE